MLFAACVVAQDNFDTVQTKIDPDSAVRQLEDAVVEAAFGNVRAGTLPEDAARQAAHAAANGVKKIGEIDRESTGLLAREKSVATDVINRVMGGAGTDDQPNPKELGELTLLAGAADDDISLTSDALMQLGWTPGVHITYNTSAGTNRSVAGYSLDLDHARTFSKNGQCLAVFAATNDEEDQSQALAHIQYDSTDFCGFQMHPGVAQELGGFVQTPNWGRFVSFLNNATTCTSVTAVGHSLGGAVATAFAGCANVGGMDGAFGARVDYGLVVFSPFAISKTPVYSGTQGTPFRGTRYGITEDDGSRTGLPSFSDTKQFRLSILTYFEGMAAALESMGMSLVDAQQLTNYTMAINQSQAVEADWSTKNVETTLMPLVPIFAALVLDPTALATSLGLPDASAFAPLLTSLTELVQNCAGRSELFFAFDPVSMLSSSWGYKHALVDFQPLRHPLKQQPCGNGRLCQPLQTRPASNATAEQPKGDLFQWLLALVAGKLDLPNHQLCCYASVDKCSDMFTGTWKQCKNTPIR